MGGIPQSRPRGFGHREPFKVGRSRHEEREG
jgi:hypothetical protein